MKLEFTDITDIELGGITEYPDFPDLFIESAWNLLADRKCTEEELDYIQEEYAQVIYEMAYDIY